MADKRKSKCSDLLNKYNLFACISFENAICRRINKNSALNQNKKETIYNSNNNLSDTLDASSSPFSTSFLCETLGMSFEFLTLSSTDEIIISLRNLSPFCRRIDSKSPTPVPSPPLTTVCEEAFELEEFSADFLGDFGLREFLLDCTDMALWFGVGWEIKLRWFSSRLDVTISPFAVTSTVLPDCTGWGCECCRLSWKL